MKAASLRPLALARRVHALSRRLLLPTWTRTRSASYGAVPAQQLDVMRPRWPARSRPVVVVFHGGGWRDGTPAPMVDRVCRRYLERGFIAVNVGYRYGVVPASADAILALDWVHGNIEHEGGDSERVFVTGESAGAHLALLAAFSVRRRVRGVVNFYAPTDLASFAHAQADPTLPANDLHNTLLRLSPLELVRPALCPVLSVHGTADTLVSLDHTSRLTRQLREVGVEAKELIVDGGDHGFPDLHLDAIYDSVFRFVDSH